MPKFKAKMADDKFEKRYKRLKIFCGRMDQRPDGMVRYLEYAGRLGLTLSNTLGEKMDVGPLLRELVARFEVYRDKEKRCEAAEIK